MFCYILQFYTPFFFIVLWLFLLHLRSKDHKVACLSPTEIEFPSIWGAGQLLYLYWNCRIIYRHANVFWNNLINVLQFVIILLSTEFGCLLLYLQGLILFVGALSAINYVVSCAYAQIVLQVLEVLACIARDAPHFHQLVVYLLDNFRNNKELLGKWVYFTKLISIVKKNS